MKDSEKFNIKYGHALGHQYDKESVRLQDGIFKLKLKPNPRELLSERTQSFYKKFAPITQADQFKASSTINEFIEKLHNKQNPDGAPKSLSPQLLRNKFNTINSVVFLEQLKENHTEKNKIEI